MLFANEFPGTKVEFEAGGWVILQPLTRSFLDSQQKQLAALSKGAKIQMAGQKVIGVDTDSIDSVAIVEKATELEYEKVKASIKEWSSEKEVSVENIKQLPDFIYEAILKKVDEINHPTEDEIKN